MPSFPRSLFRTWQVVGYANGLPMTFTDALNNPSSVAYDPNGWGYPVSAIDANNNTASGTFNVLGWKMDSTDGLGHKTISAHDNWGRTTGVTAPDGTASAIVYDLDGNVVRAGDANASPLTLSGTVAWTTGVSGTALRMYLKTGA